MLGHLVAVHMRRVPRLLLDFCLKFFDKNKFQEAAPEQDLLNHGEAFLILQLLSRHGVVNGFTVLPRFRLGVLNTFKKHACKQVLFMVKNPA